MGDSLAFSLPRLTSGLRSRLASISLFYCMILFKDLLSLRFVENPLRLNIKSQLELVLAMPMDAPRLYLITPPISDWAVYPPVFEAAMAVCDVACVLLRTVSDDEGDGKGITRACPPFAKAWRSCLVADDPQLAVRVNADGVHIDDRRLCCKPPCALCNRAASWVRRIDDARRGDDRRRSGR